MERNEEDSVLQTEYVHGYANRGGCVRPVLTVAITPFGEGQDTHFGIGVSICSVDDHPHKAYGRRQSEQRAIAAWRKRHSGRPVMTKPSPKYGQRVIGIFCPWTDAIVELDKLGLTPSMKERVGNTLRYMARKYIPEIVEA